jgi:RimJ/RimL family protein N-acetyltransferase
MATEIITDALEVLRFVKRYVPLPASESMQGIGLRRDGELVAGVVYERFTPHSCWIHVAATPGRQWLNREFLYWGFAYPFLQVGVRKLFGYVEASNHDARRFDEHLGFTVEAVLTGASMDGGDALIYSMTREQCRFLGRERA